MFYWLLLDKLFLKRPLIAGTINGAKTMKEKVDPGTMPAGFLKRTS
jgi:hypothetical protein